MTPSQSRFSFAYTLTFADYGALLAARRHLTWAGRYGRVGRFVTVIVIFFAVVLGISWHDGIPFSALLEWEVVRWYLAFPVVILAIELFFDSVVARWYFKRLAGAEKPLSIVVDASGLDWVLNASSGHTDWSAFTARVVTPDHLFLFVSKVEAFTIAMRGLEGGEWDAFLAFVRENTASIPER
ncbi:MAG: YcxB family protein [Alphaproteobacteria bacterium]